MEKFIFESIGGGINGGGSGGKVSAGSGTYIVGRNGQVTTGGNLRITGLNITMTIGGRGMVVKTKFKIQKFQYWGNTDDLTDIGFNFRVVRHDSGSPVTVYNETIDMPSTVANTNRGFIGSLPIAIEFEPDDIFYVKCVNSILGGTAGAVTNPFFVFEIE